MACAMTGPSSPEVTRAICRVPSTPFSQAPWYTQPVHLCRFRVRSWRWRYFPEAPGRPPNPIRENSFRASSPPAGWGLLTPFPSATAFALTLGARLTLRGLTLRRNPWTFGDRVSHSVYRYSCQHSRFRYLQHISRCTFAGLRNAPLPRRRTDDRCRMTDIRLCGEGRAASSRRSDSRPATAAKSARQHSPDPGSTGSRPASHRQIQAPC
jgi:hypothetical protein